MKYRWVVAVAAAVIAALGIGFWSGRRMASTPPLQAASSKPVVVTPAAVGTARAATTVETAARLLTLAEQAVAQERWVAARQTYRQILQEYPDAPEAIRAQERLGQVNVHLLFAPGPDPTPPFYATYVVQPGDSLSRIARQHGTTVELLQRGNRLTGDKILVGRSLKVPTVRFSVVVDKSQNLLTLKADEEVVKIYSVSTGKEDQTPVGTFTIVNKIVDPPWYTAQGVIPPGSPENILGSRWLGFSKSGYGIHGTTDPSTIGQSVTAGCVRMQNAEVEELYALLPLGTEVTVVE